MNTQVGTSTPPPSVTNENPAPNATGVAVASTVTATFNESVQASTVNSTNFTLKDASGNFVAATITYTDSTHTATLAPNAALANSTTYTATISGVQNSSGNPMSSPFVWSFTTADPTPSIADPGFEQVTVGAGQFQYRPTGSPWTFSGGAGISGNNSGFTSGNPSPPKAPGRLPSGYRLVQPDRQQLDCRLLRPHPRRRPARQSPGVSTELQRTGRWHRGRHVHTLWHVVSELNHRPVHRHCRGPHDHIPGTEQRRRRQYRLHRPGRRQTGQLVVNRRPGIRASDRGCGPVPVSTHRLTLDLLRRRRHQRQQQRLHLRQPAGPEGAQVAFLQGTGSFTETVSNWTAGSYVLTFDAAQRGNDQASRQDFSVLVDGTVVGTFTPSGTS